MSKKIGLEIECFVREKKGNNLAMPDDAGIASCDDCGYLAEIRGEPCPDIISAIYSLKEKVFRMKKDMDNQYKLSFEPFLKVPEEFLHEAQRKYGKGRAQDECMYGKIKPKKVQTAGLHIHFSDIEENVYRSKRGEEFTYITTNQLNMPRLIHRLDVAFKDEIKATHRQPGLYEMKEWGFEYRSLPNNIKLEKLIPVLIDFK